ncbi:hypothetical protein C0036_05485 [Streptomyces sp. DJ]|nr:hypothetical protein C0036_05485 [Streptomyces sp. DJ]
MSEIEKVPCGSSHDGEVVGTKTLTGSFDTEDELQDKAFELCDPVARATVDKLTDGRTYYSYVISPRLLTYELSGKDHVACALTLSNKQDGPKLTSPLPL